MKAATLVKHTLVKLCILTGLALPLMGSRLAIAQPASDASFQAYQLQHIKPTEAEARLTELLQGATAPTEIVVDETRNRILVQASAQEQVIVRQLLSKLDQPVVEEASLKSYPVEASKLQDTLAKLQQQYANAHGVRIAADARTSQIFVLGTPSVQTQIQAQLGGSQIPAAKDPIVQRAIPAAGVTAARTKATPTTVSQTTIPLKNTAPQNFEAALQALSPRVGKPAVQHDGKLAVYTLQSPNNSVVTLAVDRPAKTVAVDGPAELTTAWSRVVSALDVTQQAGNTDTRVLKIENSEPASVRKFLAAFPNDSAAAETSARGQTFTTALLQPGIQGDGAGESVEQSTDENQLPPSDVNIQGEPNAEAAITGEDPVDAGLIGSVQIEFLEGLDIIVIRGHKRDVERVTQIINDIERLSTETQPAIEIYHLEHVDSVALAGLIQQVYSQALSTRQSGVSITPLIKPNALLLVGREESVSTVIDLIKRLDQPVDPASQFKVFFLKHTSAGNIQTTIQQFFANRNPAGTTPGATGVGLGTKVLITSDARTNSVIVQASPRDMLEVESLIKNLDTTTSEAVNEMRIFPLQNSLAEELAPVLQEAVSSQGGAAAARPVNQGPPAPGAADLGVTGAATSSSGKSAMLRFLTIDAQGQRQINSGILSDVRITADPRANSLVVSAPAESMDLVAALIQQLDQAPSAETQIKVFTIVNGDATGLATMLETLFGIQTSGVQGQGQGQIQPSPDGSLIPLRFSVDQRTNSIVVSGSLPNLNVVEAILLRLDDSDVRQRQSTVYRLRNAPAQDVAIAINQLLTSERQVQLITPGLVSPFEQLQREVVVVPEPVSNSLIVSATPRFFEEIRRIVEQLDARPLMVTIQVLIAEVVLDNTDEFGIELGLQDSILFDRSLVGDINQDGQNIPGGVNDPGYNFNNTGPLGNASTPRALANSAAVASQGISNFAVGRNNADLGFGGLVLSASSESVSILLRALNQSRRVDVLSRPEITTLDNQPAYILVGQRVPFITSVSQTVNGTVNSTEFQDVGLILQVQPRISPEGLVVMNIDTQRSDLAPESEGIPISVSPDGQVIRSPIVNTTTAQTTVSAADGQTIVLGGLLTQNKTGLHRRVPILSDIPVLGNLFRYDLAEKRRTELLIILTPRVIRTETDAEIIKQVESSRMSWCLSDVIKMHGPSGLRSRSDEWTDAEIPTIYPDVDPFALDPFQHGPSVEEMILPEGATAVEGEEIPVPTKAVAPAATYPNVPAPGPTLKLPPETTPEPIQPMHSPMSQQGSQPAVPGIQNGTGGNENTSVRVTSEPPPGFFGARNTSPPSTPNAR